MNGRISRKYTIEQAEQPSKKYEKYTTQLPYLNIINWFVASSKNSNPLSNTFFEDGRIP